MCVSHVVFIVWALEAMVAAQFHCDPTTQYEKEGRCCLKCGPGTRMLSSSSCEEPECKECGEKEYQEKYTTSTRCERQEYCDPNKNFKWRIDEDKKKRMPCLCEDGFHCSSEACLTCVPHQSCPPGSGARSIGNHSHDTVCEKCPDGEFSGNNSWNEVCQKWKVCEKDNHKSKEGTGESDVECEESRGVSLLVVAILVTLPTVIAVLGFIIYKHHGKKGYENVTPPNDVESGQEENKNVVIERDTEEREHSNPEENEDCPSLLGQTGVTANGNVLAQERGTQHKQTQQTASDTEVSFNPERSLTSGSESDKP